jgi:CRISPR system Cascade subunit CasD
LLMGVRVDRCGTMDWDYHTVGAKIGIWQADRKKLKRTASTHEYETLLSRRQYLYDASFLVALQGDADTIRACESALDHPVWPVFLGRKCCVPGEPVLAGTGTFGTLTDALSSMPWQARIEGIDRQDRKTTRTLDTFLEHAPAAPPPDGARLVFDVPRGFGYYNHAARWIVAAKVTVPVGPPTHRGHAAAKWRDPYGPGWESKRRDRLRLDNHLCVFCKSPAVQVHHLDYDDVRVETLRSLCKTCHDACTMLEYGQDMRRRRIDPADRELRPLILEQVKRLLAESRRGRRRELLENARVVSTRSFGDAPDVSPGEGR